MQSLARGTRHGRNLGRCLQLYSHYETSASRVHWESRRSYFGPLQWIQQKFAPAPKKALVPEVKHHDAPSAENEIFGEGGAGEVQPTVSTRKTKEKRAFPERPKCKQAREHKYSTANFKISHRKLNMLGRQISGKPIDHAIMQMQFSEKRASGRIKSMLSTAKLHATVYKNMDPLKLIVSEAWVTKGPKQLKRLEPRGRGKFGIRVHPDSRLHVMLRPGKTFEQLQREKRAMRLKRIVSAGIVREDVPLRNPASSWQW
ncbi:ribosomal protein L22 [Paxillus ammoniavirescens]|nr:ribosomal protein L22 [Paxillus ammoniavirescens]